MNKAMRLDTITAIGNYVGAVTEVIAVSDLRWHTLQVKMLEEAAHKLLAAVQVECAAIAAEVDADDAKDKFREVPE